MHLKVFLKLYFLGKYRKKTQKTRPKKNHWAGFFFKPGFFPTLPGRWSRSAGALPRADLGRCRGAGCPAGPLRAAARQRRPDRAQPAGGCLWGFPPLQTGSGSQLWSQSRCPERKEKFKIRRFPPTIILIRSFRFFTTGTSRDVVQE